MDAQSSGGLTPLLIYALGAFIGRWVVSMLSFDFLIDGAPLTAIALLGFIKSGAGRVRQRRKSPSVLHFSSMGDHARNTADRRPPRDMVTFRRSGTLWWRVGVAVGQLEWRHPPTHPIPSASPGTLHGRNRADAARGVRKPQIGDFRRY